MAGYLASQFPGDYYSDDLAKSYDFAGYFNNQRQKEEAYKNQELNRQMALEDLYNKQQTNPLERQQRVLQNEGLQAGLPSIYAKAENDKRNQEVRKGVPVSEEINATRMKLAKELSDDDLKQAENAIKQAMMHPSAKVRQTGQMLYDNMFEIRKMREGLQSKEDISAATNAARERVAAEARASRATGQAKAAKDIFENIRSGKVSMDKAAVMFQALAMNEEDPDVKAKYLEAARQFEAAALERAKAGKAGAIDAGAVTGMPTTKVTPQLGTKATPGSSPDNPIILK